MIVALSTYMLVRWPRVPSSHRGARSDGSQRLPTSPGLPILHPLLAGVLGLRTATALLLPAWS